MGLDIYAGTLTRYYTHNWKTAVQQFGEAHGIPVHIIRAHSASSPATAEEIFSRVSQWRDHIIQGLALSEPPLWNEDADQTPYYTNKPGWEAITALQLFVIANMLGKNVPETIPKNYDITQSDLYQEYRQQNCDSISVLDCDWWVPIAEPAIFSYVLPNFQESLLASTGTLRSELKAINALQWNAEPSAILKWQETEGYPVEAVFQKGKGIQKLEKCEQYDTISLAKFAFSILWQAADFSLQHGVVILYDF